MASTDLLCIVTIVRLLRKLISARIVELYSDSLLAPRPRILKSPHEPMLFKCVVMFNYIVDLVDTSPECKKG